MTLNPDMKYSNTAFEYSGGQVYEMWKKIRTSWTAYGYSGHDAIDVDYITALVFVLIKLELYQ